MIFTSDGVDLPERLLQSLTSDRFVVFAGAGVSCQSYPEQPTNTYYPDFHGLALEIAQRLGIETTESDNRNLKEGFVDRVLGEWHDRTGDVRSHAAAILQANEQTQRVELHRAIVRLFIGNVTPRIVTTNFDRLLIRARNLEPRALEMRWLVTGAPALSPARRFSGICHLHGIVDSPSDMVLTDSDIGRAYMDEGWALRFAHELFQRFDVLFIGYSLEDPPLRYLSLALEGTAGPKRWVLASAPESDADKAKIARDWERRHVEPIWYAASGGDYRALERTISAWADDNSKSFLDRRSELVAFATAKPSNLKPHELSRTQYFLQDPSSLRDFAKARLDIEWFDQLVQWGHLNYLLKGKGEWKEADSVLAAKVVEWICASPVDMLAKLVPYRITINAGILDHFCRQYSEGQAQAVDAHLLRRILEFFRPIIDGRLASLTLFLHAKNLLLSLLDNGFDDDAFWLFTSVFRTNSIIKKGPNLHYKYARIESKDTKGLNEFDLGYELTFENQMAEHTARELFNKVFVPRLGTIGTVLSRCLTTKFLELRAAAARGERSILPSQ